MNLKRMDEVAFQFHGRYMTGKVLAVYTDFKAVRCEDKMGLEYLLRPEEVLTLGEYEVRKEKERYTKSLEKYQSLIDAHRQFNGDAAEISKALKINPRSLGSRIAAAKRRGLIK